MELRRTIWKVPPHLLKQFQNDDEIRRVFSPIVYLVKYSDSSHQAASSSSPIKKHDKNSDYDDAHFYKDHKSIDDWGGEASIKLQEHLAKGVSFIKARDPVPVPRDYVFPNPECQPILTRVGALPQLISRRAFIAITDDLCEKLITFKNIKKKAAAKKQKSNQSCRPQSKKCATKRRRSTAGVPDDDSECTTPKKSKTKVSPKKVQLDTPKSTTLKIGHGFVHTKGSTSLSPSQLGTKRCSVKLKRLHPNTIASYINRCSAKNL